MDIPARYLIAQQDLEVKESERIDYIRTKVYLDNIDKLRKTDSMIPVKVTYKYRDEPYAANNNVFNCPEKYLLVMFIGQNQALLVGYQSTVTC
jgi:hypothetical protein